MPSKPTPKKTLKQEKLWYIDAKKGSIYYDCSNDVNDGWWKRLDFTTPKSANKSK